MKARALALFAAGGLFACALFAACGGETADDTVAFAPRTDPTTSAKSDFGKSTCSKCIDATCASPRTGCAAEADCAATLGCIAACGTNADGDADESCRKACKKPSSSAGAAAYAAFDECAEDARLHSCKECGSDGNPYSHPLLRQNCEGHPPAPTGNVCAEFDGGTPPDQPCRECYYERCCEDAVLCEKGSECSAVSNCISPCEGSGGTAKGYGPCFAAHPTGAQPFANLLSCLLVRCVDACVHSNVPCAKCTAERCGDESAEGTSPARLVYSECTGKCADQACITECGRVNPDGERAEQLTLTCMVTRCTNECAF